MGAVLTAVLTGCSMIDEDLSNCEEPEQEQARLDYELRLVTNLTTELETELSAQTDVDISNALRQFLSSIFTDHAHDVDLSFYDTQGDSLRLQHDQHIMDASQASYTLNLPKREYMHLAVANVLDNQLVDLFDDNRCHTSNLSLTGKDTIPSHNTGLFTARQPMNVLEGVSQQFNVRLYMANCAAALIVDTQGHDASRLQVYSTGFASGFSICDSVYRHASKSPIVRTTRLDPERGSKIGFCSVTFPSRRFATSRTVIEDADRFKMPAGQLPLWEFRAYITNADGKVTETILGINEPLQPGELKIIQVRLKDDGSLTTESSEVSVSVTLDWKKGDIYTPVI